MVTPSLPQPPALHLDLMKLLLLRSGFESASVEIPATTWKRHVLARRQGP
jgi:hypothetical protein